MRLGKILILVVLLALPLGVCPRAGAKPSDRIVGVSASVPVGATPVSVEPTCRRKTRAIGGGYGGFGVGTVDPATGQSVIVAETVVYESRRASSRAWRTSAVVLRNPAAPSTAPGPGPLEAWSYCKAFKGKVREVVASGATSTSASAPSVATARCAKRQVPMSGGFSVLPVPGPQFQYPSIYEDAPVGARGWRVAAEPRTQPSVSVTSYAYCVKASAAPVVRSRTSPATIVGSRRCPKGLRVGAGGFRAAPGGGVGYSTADLDTQKRSLVPGVAYPTDRTWSIAGGAGPGSTVTVFGLCS